MSAPTAPIPPADLRLRVAGTEDPTNWFAPTTAALVEWVGSTGFNVLAVERWPEAAPSRAMARARVRHGPPEWVGMSYEGPVLGP